MIPTTRLAILLTMTISLLCLTACERGADSGYDQSMEGVAVYPSQDGPDIRGFREPLPPQPLNEITRVEEKSLREMAPPKAMASPSQQYGTGSRITSENDNGNNVTDRQIADLVSQQRIIVRTVDITVEVTDIGASLDTISRISTGMGGWVVSSNRTKKYRGSVSIRVPADQLDTAIQNIRKLGSDILSEVTKSRDVTDEYIDTSSRLKTLRATEQALLILMEKSEKVEEALKVRDSLTGIQENIEILQGRIKFIEQTSAFSLINVTLELEPTTLQIDAGNDQTTGVGKLVRFRALFWPPKETDSHTFTWDFGDGTIPVTSNRTAPTTETDARVTATVTHFYESEKDSPFIAQINIVSEGESGIAEGEDTILVNVSRIPVIEVFAGPDLIVDEDEEASFEGSFTRPGGLTDVQFRWEFGDGTASQDGVLTEGLTRAISTHTYSDHRPYGYTATLTITATSTAGQIEASDSINVNVKDSKGWMIRGWSPGEQGKGAVRTLSVVIQGIGTLLIWLVIFSPAIVILGLSVVIPVRLYKRRKQG